MYVNFLAISSSSLVNSHLVSGYLWKYSCFDFVVRFLQKELSKNLLELVQFPKKTKKFIFSLYKPFWWHQNGLKPFNFDIFNKKIWKNPQNLSNKTILNFFIIYISKSIFTLAIMELGIDTNGRNRILSFKNVFILLFDKKFIKNVH